MANKVINIKTNTNTKVLKGYAPFTSTCVCDANNNQYTYTGSYDEANYVANSGSNTITFTPTADGNNSIHIDFSNKTLATFAQILHFKVISNGWGEDLMDPAYLTAMNEIAPYVVLYPSGATGENILAVAKTASGYTHANWAAVETDIKTGKYKAVIIDPSYDKDDIIITQNCDAIIQGQNSRPITIGPATPSGYPEVNSYYGWCGVSEGYSASMGYVRAIQNVGITNIFGGNIKSIKDSGYGTTTINCIYGAYIESVGGDVAICKIFGGYIETFGGRISGFPGTPVTENEFVYIKTFTSTGVLHTAAVQSFIIETLNGNLGTLTSGNNGWVRGMVMNIGTGGAVNYNGTAYTSGMCGPTYDEMLALQTTPAEVAYLYPYYPTGTETFTFVAGRDDWTAVETDIKAGKYKKVIITGTSATLMAQPINLTAGYERVILAAGAYINEVSGNIGTLESKYGAYGHKMGTTAGVIMNVKVGAYIDTMKGGLIYTLAGVVYKLRGGTIMIVGSQTENVSPNYATTGVNDTYAIVGDMYGGKIYTLRGYVARMYGGEIITCDSYGGVSGAICKMYGGYVETMSYNAPSYTAKYGTATEVGTKKDFVMIFTNYYSNDYTTMRGGRIKKLSCKSVLNNAHSVYVEYGSIDEITGGQAATYDQTAITSGSISAYPSENILSAGWRNYYGIKSYDPIPVIRAQNKTDGALAAVKSFSWNYYGKLLYDPSSVPLVTGQFLVSNVLPAVGDVLNLDGNFKCPAVWGISLGVVGAEPSYNDCSYTEALIVSAVEQFVDDTAPTRTDLYTITCYHDGNPGINHGFVKVRIRIK